MLLGLVTATSLTGLYLRDRVIEAGRMPFDWGMGVYANDGSCWDCDFGDNVDRIAFTTLPIWNHIFGMSFDFAGNGPTSFTVDRGSTAVLH